MSADTPTLGQLIDMLDRVRDKKRELNEKVSLCSAKEEEIKSMILESAGKQGLSKATGSLATMSISKSIVPVAVDWGKVNPWVLRHKELNLFQKRLSPVRYRELLEDNPRGIPGLESHEQVRVNLRKL